MTHVTVSEAKGGSVINDSVEKEIGSLAWPGYSPPGLGFRTPEDRSGSVFSQREKEEHIQTGLGRFFDYLGEAWETEGWERGSEGGGAGGIQPVPIVATVQLHLSQQRRDYFFFTKPSRRGGPDERKKPGLKEIKKKKQKEKNPRLKAHRGLKKEGGRSFFCFFLFFFSFGDTTPAPALVAPCRSPKPRGSTSAKCVLKRPILTPLSSSPAPPAPHPLFLLTCWQGGTVIVALAGFMKWGRRREGWGGGMSKNKKASVNTSGKCFALFSPCTPPPPPPRCSRPLIRYALIRDIDHRRDSSPAESSHRTFIGNGAEPGQKNVFAPANKRLVGLFFCFCFFFISS